MATKGTLQGMSPKDRRAAPDLRFALGMSGLVRVGNPDRGSGRWFLRLADGSRVRLGSVRGVVSPMRFARAIAEQEKVVPTRQARL